ncbi:DUF72 domain-containing protein [Sutcliffiella sp. NC1]|uniref:DUF72 domain-containing protein n=1 Tax=Sutcliffiella sp. NC1 TaxID=3004096 RepID=UPI0022DE3DCD|nr:DUF72 domain-containing protein [Sutcliffiella sp. NC1]WBL14357.1 DUF72 domain-containing protein [Sutcliffiella sp. NC1]
MIYIGVTGWGDHDSLYASGVSSRDKLKEYAAHFPIVEIDSYFYAIQPKRNVEKWVQETPETFTFIPKAYQGMTGHQRGEIPFETKEEMFKAYMESLQPLQEANKLSMVLFQFPPWFDCRKENVDSLRWCRAQMGDIPVALEFRHQSWFKGEMKEKTLQFMRSEKWIHSVCDEPQAGEKSVPTIVNATDNTKTLVRFHGRNVHAWTMPVKGQEWRDIRYLYKYNNQELQDWIPHIRELEKQSKDIYILFNNNSGGDAANNAKMFIEMLGVEYTGLAPKQLDLFND